VTTLDPAGPENPLLGLLDGTRPPAVAASFDDQVTDEVLVQAVADGMDVAEVRVDRFADLELVHAANVVASVAAVANVPTLVTVRSAAEGGRWSGDDDGRAELLAALTPFAHGVDVELAFRPYLAGLVRQAHELGRVVVVSMHDFERTPPLEHLEDVVARGFATGADLVKVATRTETEDELAVLAELTRRHAADGVIVLGMGALGARSRVELPRLGSRLTFAVAPGQEAVPGQMTISETVEAMARP
jgi:3-dehydroquinate dehydratase-1